MSASRASPWSCPDTLADSSERLRPAEHEGTTPQTGRMDRRGDARRSTAFGHACLNEHPIHAASVRFTLESAFFGA